MNELYFAHRVRQHLNRGLHELPPTTIGRLEAARQRALAQQRVAVHRTVLASAGSFVHRHLDHLHLKQILAGLVLISGIAFYTYWHADQSIAELGAIDSALLADDVPIGALTDKGFEVWLKSARSQ